jgi:hypothetical protein
VLIQEIEEHRQGKIIDPRTGEAKRVPPALLSELGRMIKVNGIDRPKRDADEEADEGLVAELDAFEAEIGISPFSGRAITPPPLSITPTPDVSPAEQAKSAVDDAELRLSRITQANCSNCKQLRPRSEFARNRSRSTGLQSICKPCAKQLRKAAKAKRDAEANIQFHKDHS